MQSVSNTFPCSIVTPSRELWSGQVLSLSVPGENGYLEILPGHSPLVSALRPGFLKIHASDGEQSYFIAGGYLNVAFESTSLLAEVAESKQQIDRKRAEEAKNRAQERLKSREEGIDLNRAQLALLRALTRIEFLNKSDS